jgi:hypothetical protein
MARINTLVVQVRIQIEPGPRRARLVLWLARLLRVPVGLRTVDPAV